MSNKTKAHVMLVLMTVIWGMTFPLVKDSLNLIDPYLLVCVRFCLALFVFSLWFVKNPSALRVPLQTYGVGVLLGVLAGISYITQTIGMQTVQAGRAAFITGMNVIMVPFLARFFGLGRPNRIDVLAAFVSLCGLFLLTNPKNSGFNKGDLWVLACALDYAFYILVLQKCVTQIKVQSVFLAFSQILGICMFSFLTLFLSPLEPIELSLSLVLSMLYLGTVATIGPFWIQSRYQKDTSAQATALIFALEPVFAAFFAYVLLKEKLSVQAYIGSLLILLAIVASEWIKSRPKFKEL